MRHEVRTFGRLQDLKNKLLGGVSHLVEPLSSQASRRENETDLAVERNVGILIKGGSHQTSTDIKERGDPDRRRN